MVHMLVYLLLFRFTYPVIAAWGAGWSKPGGSFTVFVAIVIAGFAVGGWVGGWLVRSQGNARQAVLLGLALTVPWQFVFWRFIRVWTLTGAANTTTGALGDNNTTTGEATTERLAYLADNYWTFVWLGHFAAVGFGATLAGQLSYISTGYNFSNSPHTGKVTGIWTWTWGVAFLFAWLMG